MLNYSLIIPTKDIPELLARCVASIPVRDDLEIIIVDDYSDSNKVDYTQIPELQRQDLTILRNSEPKGAGYSRNQGIRVAKGKWLVFADSDDFYTSRFNDFLDRYKDDNTTDVVYNSAQVYYEDTKEYKQLNVSRYIDNYLQHRIYSEKVLRYGMWTPWSRIVKRELVMQHNLTYEEVPTGNDMMFCLRCSQYAKTIIADPTIIYSYVISEKGSLTRNYMKKLSYVKARFELHQRANVLYAEVGYIFKNSFILRLLNDKVIEDRKAYNKMYIGFMREYHINVILDVYNMCIRFVGQLLKII